MKNLKKVLPIFLVLIILFVGGCTKNPQNGDNGNETVVFHDKEFPLTVSEDIKIENAFLYNGEFPEDASFSKAEDVFALKVKNTSDKDIQLVRIYVVTDQNEYFFEITTLPAGRVLTVLEKSAQSITESEKIVEIKEENKVFFENKLSLHTSEFKIATMDKVFNIENISDTDISSDVYVYFKRVDANGDYFGGITFRLNAGKLKADEFKQIPAPHFIKENSEVLFVDYAKQ